MSQKLRQSKEPSCTMLLLQKQTILLRNVTSESLYGQKLEKARKEEQMNETLKSLIEET